MEAEAVRRWRAASGDSYCPLPSMALIYATGCLVPQYGRAWTDWAVLWHGDCATDSFHYHHVYSVPWSLAISESFRGRWFLRFVPPTLGMA
jgi:hypothetical protein